MKTNTLFKSSINVVVIVAMLFAAVHGTYIYTTTNIIELQNWWWLSHTYLFVATVLGLFFISAQYNKSKEIQSVGKAYLIFTTLKIVLSFVFLLPWLLMSKEIAKIFVGHFFLIFFPYLLVETILLIRFLNKPLDEKINTDEIQSRK
ncbi:hypothetical protein K6119_11545 [Paracrocinitomix mangrovi]|uniref:hypothetical protein n=1 Tax=Paracrocinitomix mangrovi TaxID=2862509 RepID=UPI001C8DDF8B|nr:hypothetical protein [Paracrocinitomix mangrovi]UKN00368.1 hypothetical protein K6119_11545 [Paracrocinitomix mangrovi]